jgi:hypothetical protein
VDSFIAINRETCTCDLVLKTNNDSIIRGVVVFGEQIFAEESLFVYPKVCWRGAVPLPCHALSVHGMLVDIVMHAVVFSSHVGLRGVKQDSLLSQHMLIT